MADKKKHPLRPLLVAQFLGAFNDNAWKLLVTVLAIRLATEGLSEEAGQTAAQGRTFLAFVTFLVPMTLVSIPAGALADRISKRTVIVAMKGVEVALMLGAVAALAIDPANTLLPLVIVGLMGLQSGLFSPAKYGILPELLPHERLSRGNGALEMWTFLAIIAGTAAGPALLDFAGDRLWLGVAPLVLFAVVGWVVSMRVTKVPPAGGSGGVAESVSGAWRAMRGDRSLWLAVLGSAAFWGIASLMGQNILVYSRMNLGVEEAYAGVPMALFGVGVGLGSYWAGRLSRDKVEVGLIPLGALGLGFFTLLLGVLTPGFRGTLVIMCFLGVSSGFLVVPLNSLIQWRAPADRRGGVIALTNVLVTIGMLAGSTITYALAGANLTADDILVAAAIFTLAGTVWAVWLLPTALLRLCLVLLTSTFYRVRVVGRGHVPDEGAALLTPNHVSFVDGLFLIASVDRPVRFIVDRAQFETPGVKQILHWLGAIPISSEGGPRQLMRALKDAGKYLDEGEVVCIFPEGQITRTGALLPFRRGMTRIVKGRDAVIVPVNLDRVWGSIFSRAGGKFLFKRPRRIPYPVTVAFGEPLPADTPLADVRRAVQELGTDAWMTRSAHRPPLHRTAIRTLRRYPRRLAMADGSRPKVGGWTALAGAVALARALRPGWKGQPRVGVLLPPSVPGALVNMAASMAGRASVNLNYTAGAAGMASAARQAGLTTVVTSREFLDKAGLELPQGVEPLWLEEIAESIGTGARLCAFLTGVFAPMGWLERACGATGPICVEDEATVIFSSGSTGEPKGILLSHFNIDSNVEGIAQMFQVDPDERLLGILPLFHSFGYLSLWFALNHGVGIVFHPNPLDAPAVGALVSRYQVTLLLATPTFLQVYLRRCTPEQFSSLRVVLAGAEKLRDRLRDAFQDTFGVRPLEGYGATECAPVIATGVPDFRAPGFFQPGSRRGFVGHPLPGVSVRVVDPDTFDLLDEGQPGMLLVRGPNVMSGYLGRDDLTAQVLRDGWYVTGDVAVVAPDGYVKITDRLSRFSKIGGEMVPHGRVEEALHEAVGSDVQVFAVTAVADERKGERLAVLHTLDEDSVVGIREKLVAQGLPNLFIPRGDDFVKVDALPLLGTGKIDLKALKRIARERVG